MMKNDPIVIVSLTVAVLFLVSAVLIFQFVNTKRLMSLATYEELTGRPEIENVRYQCCDHCGLNFPEIGQSICEREPNSHTVPCNEPGFCTGKEVVLNA